MIQLYHVNVIVTKAASAFIIITATPSKTAPTVYSPSLAQSLASQRERERSLEIQLLENKIVAFIHCHCHLPSVAMLFIIILFITSVLHHRSTIDHHSEKAAHCSLPYQLLANKNLGGSCIVIIDSSQSINESLFNDNYTISYFFICF